MVWHVEHGGAQAAQIVGEFTAPPLMFVYPIAQVRQMVEERQEAQLELQGKHEEFEVLRYD